MNARPLNQTKLIIAVCDTAAAINMIPKQNENTSHCLISVFSTLTPNAHTCSRMKTYEEMCINFSIRLQLENYYGYFMQ